MIKEFSLFTDIKLSLKALKCVLINQLNHSKSNYLFAWDMEESRIFIERIEKVLESLEILFGDMLESQVMFAQIEIGDD